jgi:hypothetical protein
LRGDAVENGGRWFRRKADLQWSHIPLQWQGEQTQCPYLGNRAATCTDSTRVTLQKSSFPVRFAARKCTAHFPALNQLWLATHLWTCWKTGCYPN